MKQVIFCAILLAFVSCNPTHTIMTYNVGAFGKYTDDSTPQIARIISSTGAEAVALNELDSCNRRHNVYQLEALARQLGGWDCTFAATFPFAGGSYGNGVVCKPHILRSERIALPVFDGSEPRSVALAETKDYVIASVHLDHLGKEAAFKQASMLNDWFTENYDGCSKPVFLCGDMNSFPESRVIDELDKKWELLSVLDCTYPSDAPIRCIDYIFRLRSAAPVTVISSEVLSAPEDIALASDHLPVILRFKLH